MSAQLVVCPRRCRAIDVGAGRRCGRTGHSSLLGVPTRRSQVAAGCSVIRRWALAADPPLSKRRRDPAGRRGSGPSSSDRVGGFESKLNPSFCVLQQGPLPFRTILAAHSEHCTTPWKRVDARPGEDRARDGVQKARDIPQPTARARAHRRPDAPFAHPRATPPSSPQYYAGQCKCLPEDPGSDAADRGLCSRVRASRSCRVRRPTPDARQAQGQGTSGSRSASYPGMLDGVENEFRELEMRIVGARLRAVAARVAAGDHPQVCGEATGVRTLVKLFPSSAWALQSDEVEALTTA